MLWLWWNFVFDETFVSLSWIIIASSIFPFLGLVFRYVSALLYTHYPRVFLLSYLYVPLMWSPVCPYTNPILVNLTEFIMRKCSKCRVNVPMSFLTLHVTSLCADSFLSCFRQEASRRDILQFSQLFTHHRYRWNEIELAQLLRVQLLIYDFPISAMQLLSSFINMDRSDFFKKCKRAIEPHLT